MNHKSLGIPDIVEAFGRPDRQWLFPRFCNAVILAETARPLPTQPNFSDSPGKDGGFDGSWTLPVDDQSCSNAAPFALPGWNAFQFKARAVTATPGDLISSVRGAVAELIQNSGRKGELRRYVLFTNILLQKRPEETRKLRSHINEVEAALKEGLPPEEHVDVKVFDAVRLQTVVDCHPALRDTFFSDPLFSPWDEGHRIACEQSPYPKLKVIGRDKELDQLRIHLADPLVKFVAVSGGSGMGKSRVVAEATRVFSSETFYVLSTRKGDFLHQRLHRYQTMPRLILVVEDLREEDIKPLVEQLSLRENICVVATIPTEDHLSELALREQPDLKHLSLKRLDDNAAENLFKAARDDIPRRHLAWIVQEAGGNPQVLLTAARDAMETGIRRGQLKAKVAEKHLKNAERLLGQDIRRLLETLSPLSPTDITNDAHLSAINHVFHLGTRAGDLRRKKDSLIRAGLVEAHGRNLNELTVSPPLLAAFLFEGLLSENSDRCLQLFDLLDQNGRSRLLDRLISVDASDKLSLWTHVFGEGGPFTSRDSLEKNLEFLSDLVRAAPKQTAAFLLKKSSDVVFLASRPTYKSKGRIAKYLQGDTEIFKRNQQIEQTRGRIRSIYRKLIHQTSSASDAMIALEHLGLTDTTFVDAPRTSFSSLFAECFVPWVVDFPLPPAARFKIVERLLSQKETSVGYTLGCQALFAISAPPHSLSGDSVERQKHEEPPPHRLLWQDLWDYQMEAFKRHIALAARIGHAQGSARSHLLAALHEAISRLPPDSAFPHIAKVCAKGSAGRFGLRIGKVVEVLDECHRTYSKFLSENPDATWAKSIPRYLTDIASRTAALKAGPFISRLELALGDHSIAAYEKDLTSGRYAYDIRLEALAREWIGHPRLTTSSVVKCLLAKNVGHSFTFLNFAGRADLKKSRWAALSHLTRNNQNARTFAAYCLGVSNHDDDYVERHLNAVSRSPLEGAVLLQELAVLGPKLSNRKRLQKLIRQKHVTPQDVAIIIGGFWLANLPAAEVRHIFAFVAADGTHLSNHHVVTMAAHYVHQKKRVSAQLLPSLHTIALLPVSSSTDDHYHRDQIANAVAKTSLTKGLILLQALFDAVLSHKPQDEGHHWNPIDGPGSQRDFISYLQKYAPVKTYREILRYLGGIKYRYRFHGRPTFDLEQNTDSLIRLTDRNEKNAILVINELNHTQPGYWAFVEKLVPIHSKNSAVSSALIDTLEVRSGFGHFSQRLGDAIAALQSQLKGTHINTEFRRWLETASMALTARKLEFESREDMRSA